MSCERETQVNCNSFPGSIAHYERTTDTAYVAEPLSLSLAVDGTRYEASGITDFFLCQIDDDRRRDTIQGLRQCKYDKKVTSLPRFSELSVRGMVWAFWLVTAPLLTVAVLQ